MKSPGVEGSGGEHADCSVGRGELSLSDELAKCGLEAVEDVDLGAAEERRAGGGCEAPTGFKGIADGMDALIACGTEQRGEHAGKHVGVFVGIDMGEREAEAAESCYLGGGFGFDFAGADAIEEEILHKLAERWTEAAGGLIHKCGQLRWGQDWFAIDEDDVAAYAEAWGLVRDVCSLAGCLGDSHEGGRGEGELAMEFDDGSIDACGQAKVIGVHDESFHSVECINPGVLGCRLNVVAGCCWILGVAVWG